MTEPQPVQMVAETVRLTPQEREWLAQLAARGGRPDGVGDDLVDRLNPVREVTVPADGGWYDITTGVRARYVADGGDQAFIVVQMPSDLDRALRSRGRERPVGRPIVGRPGNAPRLAP